MLHASAVLWVKEVRSGGVLVLQGKGGAMPQARARRCAPFHLPYREPEVDPHLVRPGVGHAYDGANRSRAPCTCCRAMAAVRAGTRSASARHALHPRG